MLSGWVGGGGLQQEVLFRANWNLILLCFQLNSRMVTQGEYKMLYFCL